MQKDQQQTAIIQPLDATDTVESSVDALAQGEAENAEVAEFNRLMRERETRKKKRVVHRIIAVAVVAVLIIGFMVVHAIITPSDGGVSPLSTATVERGHFVDQVSSTGSIEPINSTVVAPQIDGTIGEVNAGDVLFTINNDKLDSDVNQADLALRAANSNLNAAQQQVNQINATIGQARNQDGEEGQAAADDAAGQLPAAQSGVESAQVAVQQAQATYDEAVAQANKRTVTAPVSGTVLTMSAVPGAAIGASSDGSSTSAGADGKPLCQIADLSQMKVNVNINELDITKVAKDQSAKVTFSAVPGLTLDAKVDTIASTTSQLADSSAGGQSGNGGVGYAVRLIIPAPDPKLKPGMTASVKITMQSIDNALMVPLAAIVDEGKESSAVMLETNAETHEFKRVRVTVKAKNNTKAVVEGNVSKGDVIMLDGASAADNTGDAASSTSQTADMFPFRSDASRANRGKRRNETIAVPTATANVIEVENINRIFETGDTYTHVLKGITMNVRQGEFLAIMGPSGSGKSTLMNTLGLLDRPSSGTYRLCGMDVQNLSDDERSELRGWLIGFVFQSFNLLPRTSVLRNVILPLAYSDCPVREREGRAIKALQSVALSPELFDRKTNELSGGQMQRVAIARALVQDPPLILGDEPTGNLDSKTGDAVMHTFEQLKQQGKTIVLITHSPEVAERADRCLHMRDGVLREGMYR